MTNIANADQTLLPPIEKFTGKSELLIKDSSHPWQTPAERFGLNSTPNYVETFEYIDRLVDSSSKLVQLELGHSPQNRAIKVVLATSDGLSTLESIASSPKFTVFIQAGIHSGEIDGKDAGLMLLRDIIHGDQQELLDNVNVVFLPILNVDGHERSSEFNRVNQRGPTNMGWRTTAQNLNLNRDYAKADAVEMRAVITALEKTSADLYIDIHVTDGEDYQYDITYGFNGEHGYSPNISRYLQQKLRPAIDDALKDNGHLASALVFGLDSMNFSKGIYGWTASPRFSNGWGDARHLPTILVENHSLKPYKQRVLGTYIFLQQMLVTLNGNGQELIVATEKDKKHRPKNLVVDFVLDMDNPTREDFHGIDYTVAIDDLTGIEYVNWNGKKKLYKNMPTYWQKKPKTIVKVPKAYYLGTEHTEVIKLLKLQGIKVEQIDQSTRLKLTQLTAVDHKFNDTAFEGRQTVSSTFLEKELEQKIDSRWVRINTDQDLGKFAVTLLDPHGTDSLFSWGSFNQMFQRTEYIETYVIVPLAQKMLADDKLLAEFKQAFPSSATKSSDQNEQRDLFKEQRNDKMRWIYERSNYYDKQYLKYPVLIQY
ncbi:M14 family metallopeptidase [Thalassotalea crassostreae]|uniref:M14 family metallopeptidase n=1 Tax=Thalassotalea crassostreae TaxID=1763536 RepID=UPI000837ED22|nr:M14 family metallopeptidase [Thalassotalea crassostreae]